MTLLSHIFASFSLHFRTILVLLLPDLFLIFYFISPICVFSAHSLSLIGRFICAYLDLLSQHLDTYLSLILVLLFRSFASLFLLQVFD